MSQEPIAKVLADDQQVVMIHWHDDRGRRCTDFIDAGSDPRAERLASTINLLRKERDSISEGYDQLAGALDEHLDEIKQLRKERDEAIYRLRGDHHCYRTEYGTHCPSCEWLQNNTPPG